MKEESSVAIPCQKLLDELQIGLLTIGGQLPIVSSIFKWLASAKEKKDLSPRFGWMLISDHSWITKNQIDPFISLKRSVHTLHPPLESLMRNIQEFAPFPKIQSSLRKLEKVYRTLPPIEPEIHLLSLGHSLFENQELIPHFLLYIEHVDTLDKEGKILKQLLIEETFDRLNLSLN